MFDQMLNRAAAASTAGPGDMNAVAAGRFQVLDVDADTSIKAFVEAQGVIFNKGRGFYEFTKSETVQDYKQIILMNKTSGDMFEVRLQGPADKMCCVGCCRATTRERCSACRPTLQRKSDRTQHANTSSSYNRRRTIASSSAAQNFCTKSTIFN